MRVRSLIVVLSLLPLLSLSPSLSLDICVAASAVALSDSLFVSFLVSLSTRIGIHLVVRVRYSSKGLTARSNDPLVAVALALGRLPPAAGASFCSWCRGAWLLAGGLA